MEQSEKTGREGKIMEGKIMKTGLENDGQPASGARCGKSNCGPGEARGCETKLFPWGDPACFRAKAELAFRTPRRFARKARPRKYARSWSACAPAPLSLLRPPFWLGTYTPTSRSCQQM